MRPPASAIANRLQASRDLWRGSRATTARASVTPMASRGTSPKSERMVAPGSPAGRARKRPTHTSAYATPTNARKPVHPRHHAVKVDRSKP